MKKDKLKHTDVDICICCDSATETPKGSGIRPVLCDECGEMIRVRYLNWELGGGS